MGNLPSALHHAVRMFHTKDHHINADSSEEEVSQWCKDFAHTVSLLGFETAFKRHLRDIAEIADKHDSLLRKSIAEWLAADSDTAFIVKHHRNDELSQQDMKTGRRPDGTSLLDRAQDESVPGVVEASGKFVKVYREEPFRNWGETVSFNTSFTFVPKTETGVINIVKFAIKEGRRVRVSGSGHSWSSVFGGNDDIIISMMEMGAALSSISCLSPNDNPQDTELESVKLDGISISEDGSRHAKVRLGAACTSELFRQWTLSNKRGGGDWKWMIHALPTVTAITSGGWTQPICHGAGIMHKSVSDLCIEMRIVNCKGELQTISDPQQMRAIAGSFGLLGVITSQVFIMDPMKIALLNPQKIPTMLAVPPVNREDVPAQKDFRTDFWDAQLRRASEDFEKDCTKFYAEWSWFPFQDKCWVNCWDTDEVGEDRPVYPDTKEVHAQILQASLARLFEVTLLRFLPAVVQARLMGWAAMFFMPTGSVPTSVSNALHLRRGIHRMPIRDCELAIEIPAKSNGSPDFSICQKAWWHAINEVYETMKNHDEVPMRTTLEMRVVGGSEVYMSTQRGNRHGTCAIEVLTNTSVPEEEWKAFIDRMAARWRSLTDPLTNEPLRVRPHWAKEWPSTMRGKDIMKYLKTTYRSNAEEFKAQLEKVAKMGGYELKDAFAVFGNDTMLNVIESHEG